MKVQAVDGAPCFYDSFAGPIKANLRPVINAHNGEPVWLDLVLTESVGAYKKGEVIRHVPPRYAVPRAALKTNPFGVFYILPFAWCVQ